ncbi:hypothetical protein ACWPM1_08430 [Tsuneonella sp. HG249]
MLARTIRRAREPLLAQMRLAWWRERLAEDPKSWPNGEPVLAMLGRHWGESSTGLLQLVDGWEELLGDAPLLESAIQRFAAGRGNALEAFAKGAAQGTAGAAQVAGRRWALADLSFRSLDVEERQAAVVLGRALPSPVTLPRTLRGIAVLDGLAHRALVRNEPILTGRAAALLAMRLGMLGR